VHQIVMGLKVHDIESFDFSAKGFLNIQWVTAKFCERLVNNN
jgi:hypothetical protein